MSEPSHLLRVVFSLAPLLTITLAILLLVLLAVVVVWWARRKRQFAQGAGQGAGQGGAQAIGVDNARGERRRPAEAARRILARVEAMTGLRNRPYLIPWIAVAGSDGAATQAMIAELDPPSADGEALPAAAPGPGCTLHLRRQGVIVQVDEPAPGDGSWLRHWKDTVRMVGVHRPDRPLDGMVIAVPATALLGEPAQLRERLTGLGEQFYQMIAAQQRISGLRTPVWLVLTGAEALDGFVPFVRALPEDARDGVLGWTSPYALDTAFSPSWVDEGIGSMVSGLSSLQLHVLTPEHDESDADRIFLLPAQVADLAHGLTLLLTPMLRASAYHEGFLFRGFYLTGRVPLDAEAEPAAGVATLADRAVFLRALFDDKVFREYRLARPAQGALSTRKRQIRLAQATLVGVGIVGLLALSQLAGTKERIGSVRQLVDTMLTEVSRVRLALETRPDSAEAERLIAARSLTQAMSRVSVSTIETWAAPTSHLTGADARIEKAIADAYDAVILKAVWSGLKQKLRSILVDARSFEATQAAPSPSAQAALDHFARHVDELAVLDRFVGEYQSLRETQNILNLAALVEYTFDVNLPPDFHSNFHLYQEALGRISTVELPRNELRVRAEPHLRDLMDNLFATLFVRSPLQQAAQELARTTGSGRQRADDQLRQMRALLATIDHELSTEAYEWLGRDDAALTHVDRLTRLARLSFITPEFVESVRQEGRRQMVAARTTLLGLRAFGDRPIIVRQDGRAVLAADLQALKARIDAVFQQPFAVAAQATAAGGGRSAGGRLSWDPKALRDALTGAQGQLASAVESGTKLPAGGRRLIQAAQQELMSDYVDALVAGAARAGAADGGGWSIGDSGLRAEVLNFAASAPLLVSVQESLEVLGFTQPASRLRNAVTAQASRILRETDARLAAEAPYRPLDAGFAGWTGSGLLAEPAFGASSIADLAVMLALRREFVEQLARDFAQPAVEYLDGIGRARGSDDALVARWMLIIRALQRFQMREPGNSIERLDQFILATMDQIDLGNCLTETAGREQAADYFGEQLVHLRQALAVRCVDLIRTDAQARYGRLQAAFNTDLAGRFPFTGFGPGGEPLPDRGQFADADPNDVRRFFLTFDAEIGTLPPRLRDSRLFAAPGRNAAAFLDQMARVRGALAPMLGDPALNTPLSYEIATEFRTNTEREVGGNQILQWSFTVRNSLPRPAGSAAIWTQGDPVAVTLRWARNAPQIPVAPEVGLPTIDDVNATFAFADPWSLLSLVAVQTPPRAWLLALPDRRPEVLSFTVPLDRNPQAAPGGIEVERAEVFMRLALTAVTRPPGQPEKRETVTLPFFPAAAPALSGDGGRWLGGVRRGDLGEQDG